MTVYRGTCEHGHVIIMDVESPLAVVEAFCMTCDQDDMREAIASDTVAPYTVLRSPVELRRVVTYP